MNNNTKDQQAELNAAYKKLFGKDMPDLQQRAVIPAQAPPQIPFMGQGNLSTQQTKSLNYFEYLSLILVVAKSCGLLNCNWVWPFVPAVMPFVLYGFIVVIGLIKNKFFTK